MIPARDGRFLLLLATALQNDFLYALKIYDNEHDFQSNILLVISYFYINLINCSLWKLFFLSSIETIKAFGFLPLHA